MGTWLLTLLAAVPLGAQATGGALEGRLTDEHGLALHGAIVTVRDQARGFQRSLPSDASGWVRFPRLPIGLYDVRAEMTGFVPRTLDRVRVEVGATTSVAMEMAVAGRAEQLTVAGEAPLIDVRQSGVGEIVTSVQIENLPLNGRQFGNLAALVPGVGLGFHNDPTKSTQFAPQLAGGTGRNVSYQIDGGDDNDDTVGGLVQSFPLDAVAEFNFATQRFKAEYGRSNGGVLSVVTKGGTNTFTGSAFNYFRDKALNSRTETERRTEVPKGDYRRWQYGGSLGGPIRKDRTHFFLSFERIQQDTTQSVDTSGLYPERDGVFGLPSGRRGQDGRMSTDMTAAASMSSSGGSAPAAPSAAARSRPVLAGGDDFAVVLLSPLDTVTSAVVSLLGCCATDIWGAWAFKVSRLLGISATTSPPLDPATARR